MKKVIDFTRTKIIGTIGPASSDTEVIRSMILAGLDVFRLNCSHASCEDLEVMIRSIKGVSREMGHPVGILADLCGPKIRLESLRREMVVSAGDLITLTSDVSYSGDDKLPAGYPGLANDLDSGKRILIDDGLIQLSVESVSGQDILCRVLNDGLIKSRKGINLPGTHVSLSSITEKDRVDIDFLVGQEIDYLALSFVREASDIRELRSILESYGKGALPIVAKIEKPEAVENLESIVDEANIVMVARGDLGVEMPAEEVPVIQKRIVNECNRRYKPVIIATQMLESMIKNPRPTRAEASDVANAVLDGADAVMLSGETSVGAYPVESVKIMNDIAHFAEKHRTSQDFRRLWQGMECNNIEESICRSAAEMAELNNARAIICLTDKGRTPVFLSRFRSPVPVIAFTERPEAVRFLSIVWGVTGKLINNVSDTDTTLDIAANLAKKMGYIEEGDTVVFTAGIPLVESPHTNMIKVQKIL